MSQLYLPELSSKRISTEYDDRSKTTKHRRNSITIMHSAIIQQLKKKIVQHKKQIQNRNQTIIGLQRNFDSLTNIITEERQELEQIRQQLKQYEQENKKYGNISQKHQLLQAELNVTKNQLRNLKRLHQQCEKQAIFKEEYFSQIQSLSSNVNKLGQENLQLKNEIKDLERKKQGNEREVMWLLQENKNKKQLEAKIVKMEGELHETLNENLILAQRQKYYKDSKISEVEHLKTIKELRTKIKQSQQEKQEIQKVCEQQNKERSRNKAKEAEYSKVRREQQEKQKILLKESKKKNEELKKQLIRYHEELNKNIQQKQLDKSAEKDNKLIKQNYQSIKQKVRELQQCQAFCEEVKKFIVSMQKSKLFLKGQNDQNKQQLRQQNDFGNIQKKGVSQNIYNIRNMMDTLGESIRLVERNYQMHFQAIDQNREFGVVIINKEVMREMHMKEQQQKQNQKIKELEEMDEKRRMKREEENKIYQIKRENDDKIRQLHKEMDHQLRQNQVQSDNAILSLKHKKQEMERKLKEIKYEHDQSLKKISNLQSLIETGKQSEQQLRKQLQKQKSKSRTLQLEQQQYRKQTENKLHTLNHQKQEKEKEMNQKLEEQKKVKEQFKVMEQNLRKKQMEEKQKEMKYKKQILSIKTLLEQKDKAIERQKVVNKDLWEDNKKLKENERKLALERENELDFMEEEKCIEIQKIRKHFGYKIQLQNRGKLEEEKNNSELKRLLVEKNKELRITTENNIKLKNEVDFYRSRNKEQQGSLFRKEQSHKHEVESLYKKLKVANERIQEVKSKKQLTARQQQSKNKIQKLLLKVSKLTHELENVLCCNFCVETVQNCIRLKECGHIFCKNCQDGYVPSCSECQSKSQFLHDTTVDQGVQYSKAIKKECEQICREIHKIH